MNNSFRSLNSVVSIPDLSLSLSDKQRLQSAANHLSIQSLFNSLDINNTGKLSARSFELSLRDSGIYMSDKRLLGVKSAMDQLITDEITMEQFTNIIQPAQTLIERALKRQLVIPDWSSFTAQLTDIYNQCKLINTGKVASYIPELARADRNWFGLSFCSIDGQMFNIGDSKIEFSLQSSSKPISYLLALEESTEEAVHRHVGREPSGRSFNELQLNTDNLPHNPYINSGAIMICSLIQSQLEQSARFRYIMDYYQRLSGYTKTVSFSNSTYLSERATADRNFCLAYMMQEAGAFQYGRDKLSPPRQWSPTDLVKHLELYFQCCSIESCTEGQAVIAATLASGGLCPLTGDRCFKARNVRNALSIMLSCGMYDYSGEWAYKIGLPAKSGVSGCLMIVIPNVGGLSIYSPALDDIGNTVRGIAFSSELVNRFSFHYYDGSSRSNKVNPTEPENLRIQNELIQLCYLCARGDLTGIRALLASGSNINSADYDRRTPLHLAASEGQLAVVKYLVSKGANINAADRWNNTPYIDAVREGHKLVAEFLYKQSKQSTSSSTANTSTNVSTVASPAFGPVNPNTAINITEEKTQQTDNNHLNNNNNLNQKHSPNSA